MIANGAVGFDETDRAPHSPPRPACDPLGSGLVFGLGAVVLLSPLPLGSVAPAGRAALEVAAGLLLALWTVRAWSRPTALPRRGVRLALAGLLGLTLVQALPLGARAVSFVSPTALAIRADSRPPDGVIEAAEADLLGESSARLEVRPALSVAPEATASALRAGCALVALFLVATAVASRRAARIIGVALVVSAGFQGLYGLLVLASGHDTILGHPKQYYLDSATGTFVNRNHYASYLALGLAAGAGLLAHEIERRRARAGVAELARWIGREGGRTLLLGLLCLFGLAGLLTSLSRAGTALGLAALAAVALVAGSRRRRGRRLVAVGLLCAVASVPLIQLGAERLTDRLAGTGRDLFQGSGRAVVWSDTLGMLGDFPLVGPGYGTFAAVYPLYRSPGVRLFYAHAHNDWLQAIVEGGAAGAVLWGVLLALIGARVVRGVSGAAGPLALGLAAGLAAALLHGLIDFPFRIPAHAATAAIAAGLLEGLPWPDAD